MNLLINKTFFSLFTILIAITSTMTDATEVPQSDTEKFEQQISFGDLKSPVQVYFFTDWLCPICQSVEPRIEKMTPALMQKAQVIFVDFPVHKETPNFIPYSLSFMLNNKPNYIELRHEFGALAKKTKTPTKEEVEKIAAAAGTKYVPIDEAVLKQGLNYAKGLITQFDLDATPTVVVINKQTGKKVKFVGPVDLTQESLLKAIETLKTN